MTKVPEITSIYKKEPPSDPYIINFAPELISFIKSGKKVATYRFGDKYDYLEVGDVVKVKDNDANKIVGEAVIVGKQKTTFAELPFNTPGHETYENKEHQRKVFSGYYAFLEREINDNDPFLVLEYKSKTTMI